jgi:hypothetical protein
MGDDAKNSLIGLRVPDAVNQLPKRKADDVVPRY